MWLTTMVSYRYGHVIFGFTLNVRAYFKLFDDTAGMDNEVHRNHIVPGMALVKEMQTE